MNLAEALVGQDFSVFSDEVFAEGNEKADATEATAKAGRRASRMKPSRETCLHRESIIPWGWKKLLVRQEIADCVYKR